uniref:pectinesterase inhibitor 9-like n=1 Tax=Erigeron canadensis TaxID=72917 RepID=UPI001CB9BF1D|nr:pectinesterase inhibitor 9-like [Erigeron canadensis]
MAQYFLCFLVISLTIFAFSITTVESRSRARMYLELQCRSALYPDLCVETLLPYVSRSGLPSPQMLSQISLATCLSKARYTKTYLNMIAKKLLVNETGSSVDESSEYNYQAIEECLRQINDGVNQITHSFKELQQIGKDGDEKFVWHESNVQTWVSAALTDATTCIDGLLGDGMISRRDIMMIKARFLNVKQLASNSLAMFSRFTTRYRASRGIKNPKILT